MTKKIGIIIGLILMMSFLSGLNATTYLHIHNVWIGTGNDVIISFPQSSDPTITVHDYNIDSHTITLQMNFDYPRPVHIEQGERYIDFTISNDYPGIHDIDVTFPGPWQIDTDTHIER